MNKLIIDYLSDGSIDGYKKLRGSVGVSFLSEKLIVLDPEIFGTGCQEGVLLGVNDQITFCYFDQLYEGKKEGKKVSKKSIKHLLSQSQSGTLGSQLKDKQYLVLMFRANSALILVGVDIANKQHPKITTAMIDTLGHHNSDGDKVYKNRTITEQFDQLSKDTGGGERKLSLRAIKKFFQKDALTEDFYYVYKTKLFDHIKKDLKNRYSGQSEDQINNFILINLNRLLFIHFLDKKGGVFPDYDAKRGSYISYVYHNIYAQVGTSVSCYESLLKPLFFEVFAKPQSERKLNHSDILYQEFYELPYLNGGLFKQSIEEKNSTMEIDNVFIKVFITDIIDQFNFTITEDTPLDVSVAVDPELLGYIFENLIQEYDAEQLTKSKEKTSKSKKDNQRSSGGIFYTPKVEVDFMCRQSLVEWLSKDEALKDEKKSLYELFYPEQGGSEEQKAGSFSLTQIRTIFELLETVTVVDPTCGSGAFLVGMMQVILDVENILLESNIEKIKAGADEILKEYLRTKYDTFKRKKQLIKSSLHGVDIKAWAVEIAKLRLWLSMIVDADPKSFQGVSAKTKALLPSFAFKILQGDSLINRIGYGLIPLDLRQTGEISAKARANIFTVAKLKQEFYDNKIHDEQQVWDKEYEIFHEILRDKIKFLKSQRTKLIDQLNESDRDDLFGEKKAKLTEVSRRKLEKIKSSLSSEIEVMESQRAQLEIKQKSQFAWAVAYSDIMLEKGGFDVMVGNPPYVRQEEIADPTGQIKDKKVYKSLCQNELISQDRNQQIETIARIKGGISVGGRSDLYMYFYFRGLALINDRGVFSFITSNSFLDVDFGSSLQEFLIRFCPRIKVIDNAVQRSFVSASINTVMVFLDKPIISTDMMTGVAQFINFAKEYDQALWSQTLAELDPDVYMKPTMDTKTITTGDVTFVKRSNELLRVIDISATDLWKDGSEDDSYIGNKWGGKYLRAPEIFFTVLDKGGDKLVKIGDIAEVKRGFTTGVNEFFYLPNDTFDITFNDEYVLLKNKNTDQIIEIEKEFIQKVIKSPRDCTIGKIVDENLDTYVFYSKIGSKIKEYKAFEYIKRGENEGFHKGSTVKSRKYRRELSDDSISNLVGMMSYNERFNFWINDKFLADARLYNIFYKGDSEKLYTSINNSFCYMMIELFGRANLGDGALDFKVYENQIVYILDPKVIRNTLYLNRDVNSIFEELGFDKNKSIRSQIPYPLPDRKELDDIVFDELGLTSDERNEIYWSLAELVKARLDKAKSK